MEYTDKRITDLWKSQTKAKFSRGKSRSWPPFHIIFMNRKVEPVNRGYAERAFSNSELH